MSRANAIGCGTGIVAAATLVAALVFGQHPGEVLSRSTLWADDLESTDLGDGWRLLVRGGVIAHYFKAKNLQGINIYHNTRSGFNRYEVTINSVGSTPWRLDFKDFENAKRFCDTAVKHNVEVQKNERENLKRLFAGMRGD